jgi:FAD:protein FMN transferase
MKTWMQMLYKILKPQEWLIVLVSLLISGMIVSSVIWLPSSSISETLAYEHIGYAIRIETTTQKKVTPFYTIFQVVYEKQRPKAEIDRVKTIVETMIPTLHQLADRHHDFYADETKTTIVNNIKRVNETLATGEPITIDFHLYEMLRVGIEMGKLTQGQFNMFIGELSAFWDDLIDDPDYGLNVQSWDPFYNEDAQADLNHYLNFLPKTEQDFDDVLTLTELNGMYTAQLHPFKGAQVGDLSITLGAIAKGYANDVIATMLQDENLHYGFINNGSSSILALGEKSNDESYVWNVTSPSTLQEFAFEIEIKPAHGLSTSGSYNGRVVMIDGQPTLRHHIIDPSTGYPSDFVYEINALSLDLPSLYLDILTTALMTMPIEQGYQLYQHFIDEGYDLYLSWIDIIDSSYLKVTYTPNFIDYINPIEGVTYELFA